MSLRAELIVPGDSVAPGERTSADLLVCNDGHIVDAYDLELLGDPGDWDTRRLGRVVVFPGTSEQITIPLAPPRSGQLTPGPLPFAVKVVSSEDPGRIAVPEAALAVGEFFDVEAKLARKTVKGRFSAAQFVTLRNAGNAPAHIRIRCAPQEDTAPVRVRTRRARVELDPGERARIGIDLNNTKPTLLGGTEACALRLRVEWDAQAEQELEFTYERLPFLTKKAVKGLALLAAAAVAGVALWLSPVGGKATPKTQSLPGPSQRKQQEQSEKDKEKAQKQEQEKQDKEKEAEEKKKEEDKAPKQKSLQRPLSVTAERGTKSDQYTVPKGYELRLASVSVTVGGPANGTWKLTAHQGTFANGTMAQGYQHEWKEPPYTVPEGKSVKLTVECPVTAAGAPSPQPSAGPSASGAPSQPQPTTCTVTAQLAGILVPTKGPFNSPPPLKPA
ncbi:hypothetical protein [Streptomyces sp. NPDC001404]|uniref:COG1470 family protein n=1 Tax=Streptomyces sp. NPDC001404 TaxID=3364571 RepID=UPI0036C37287